MSWEWVYRYSDWFGQPICISKKWKEGLYSSLSSMVLYSISEWSVVLFAFFSKAIHDIIRDVFIVYKNGSDYKVVGWQLIGKNFRSVYPSSWGIKNQTAWDSYNIVSNKSILQLCLLQDGSRLSILRKDDPKKYLKKIWLRGYAR